MMITMMIMMISKTMVSMIALYVALVVLLVLCLYNLWNNHYVYSQFKAFNDNIKDWARNLDATTREEISRQAMFILTELDEKVNNLNNNEKDEKESDETE